MGDIKCGSCGEPWDSALDMEPTEKVRFRRGEGCPCCRFGTACPSCDGSGREESYPADCETCRDRGYVLAWSPRNSTGRFRAGDFYVGYEPRVRGPVSVDKQNIITLGTRYFPELIRVFQSADGRVEEWWIFCPDGCADKTDFESCSSCDGTGKLKSDEDAELKAAESEINNSDEEPIGILINRGLL